MPFEQRMNSHADKEAEKGREGDKGVVFDFPWGEMNFALFHKGVRVMGDARRHIIVGHREGLKNMGIVAQHWNCFCNDTGCVC